MTLRYYGHLTELK